MISRLSQALVLAAFTVLATMGTGCSSDPCDDVSCSAGQVCEAGECVADGPNLCEGKTCPTGTGCNPDTGNCMNLCSLPTAPTCNAPETCNPATGACVNKCAGVTCDSNTLACNPQSGLCEAKCKPTTCPATHACVPDTGACVERCETTTKPTGQPECGAGLKCKTTTGACVPLCDGVACGYAQWCDDATGQCKGGKSPEGRPGSACEDDADCGVPNAPAGMEFSCRESFPEFDLDMEDGYCTATCNQAMPCPLGSECFGSAGCLDTCTKDTDCRDGWRCNPIGGQVAICLPATACSAENPDDCSPIGGDCRESGDCVTGADCITEMSEERANDGSGTGVYSFSGFEDGYCLWAARTTDTCPAGTVQVPVGGDQDPTYAYCMTSCTTTGLGECGFGESCWNATQTGTAGICWEAQCVSDRDCNFAPCTANNTNNCGEGQTCGTDGFCSTNDKCKTDADCGGALMCGANGECTPWFCENASAVCLPHFDSATADAQLKAEYAQIGLVPDQAGSWERRCTIDDNCGNNAYCAPVTGQEYGVCERRCSVNNEADICGDEQVCNESTGKCQDKCTSNDECADGLVCDAGGHCATRCDADVNPTQCLPTQACDTDSGLCDARCTRANEATICGPKGKVCQTSTGMCVPSCHDNPSVCGDDEACSVTTGVNNTQIGYCGKECVTDSNCGNAPTGEALSCVGPAGARFCQFKACTEENAATVCGATQVCVDNSCRSKCSAANEAMLCGADQICDVEAGTCIAKCQDSDDCAEGEACNAGGKCVVACTLETQATVCGDAFCDASTGLCVDDCSSDAQCGVDFVCESGNCVASCTASDCGDFVCGDDGHCTETARCDAEQNPTVCDGSVCNETNGKCEACTTDAQCGPDRVCSGEAGCIASCSAATGAFDCGEYVCGENGHCTTNLRCDAEGGPECTPILESCNPTTGVCDLL